MIWPLRAILGPLIWAIGFGVIYALHGLGCAKGWMMHPAPFGDWHHVILITTWLLFLTLAALVLLRAPRGPGLSDRLIRTGGWIGFVSLVVTLFPVLGVSSCGDIGIIIDEYQRINLMPPP